jgi:hypothetical protein
VSKGPGHLAGHVGRRDDMWALPAAGRLVVVLTAALYFAPTLVAQGRRHHQAGAIFVLSLFLGWTLLGWVVALVWAFT